MINFLRQRCHSSINLLSIYLTSRPLRSILISSLLLLSIFGVYIAILKGLSFLIGLGGLGSVIIKHLFYLLFLIIFFMVALSFSILYYAASFRNKEVKFLMALPYNEKKISFLKFIESAILAGWIPLAGSAVFIFAYSKINNLPLFIPLLSAAYLIPFIIIASYFGYILCIVILKFMNLKKGFILILIIFTAIMLFYKYHRANNTNVFHLLSEEIIFFKVSMAWFMPFSWAPWAIIRMENGNFLSSFIFLINLWSLSLLSLSLIYSYGGKIFREMFFKYSVPDHKRDYRQGYLDKVLTLSVFPVNTANFILKDIKMFIREPVLWMQFLVFFGLLFFYFINLQRFSYNLLDDTWKNLITFLNTFSVLCISSALAIRFVFPQWSLEGRNYWILKLSPVRMRDILRAKLILSLFVLTSISVSLIIISDKMLQLNRRLMFLTISITVVSIFSLTSFSLGLGAYFADFKKEYYLKAVESLGGFVALILNFGYIIITIFSFALINHIFIVRNIVNSYRYMLWALTGWSLVSIMLGFALLHAGIKKLRKKEY